MKLAALAFAAVLLTTPTFATTVCWDDPVVVGQCDNPAPELAPLPRHADAMGVQYTTTSDLGGGHKMVYFYYASGTVIGAIDGETVSVWITKNGHLVKTYQR